MADVRTIFDEPHHQSLELLATKALAANNFNAAFKFADRRCRILPTPEAHCFLLRGEASYNLGAKTAAIADVARALEIDPDNVAANRRMLAWSEGTQQLRAAIAIINNDKNLMSVRDAARILHKHGQRTFANLTVFDDVVTGWAVWDRQEPLDVSITAQGVEIGEKFDADVFHPLAECGQATSFRLPRPRTTSPQTILLATAGSIFQSTRAAGNERAPNTRVLWPRSRTSNAQTVTVVVPVYADYDATRLCIQSLMDELQASKHRAILVDDATPDPRIAEYLVEMAAESLVEVIANDRNIGFIGSVNRALERITTGDVIFLNSDTIVPRGFIDRLAAAARSSTDIGTITPLSNNGEFVSFPTPNTSNTLASRQEIERIDGISATVNSGKVVDIPSGIGFCLYVTRSCLDRVGPLSEDFARGYLEDVDFCLRARGQGFRNICAPSVYVGHAGSKSFGTEKRSLVVRNLRVLERRFPNHRRECAAFIEADPLRPARQAIEQLAASVASHPRLFVTGPGAVSAVARHRARQVASAAEPSIILEIRHRADGAVVKINNATEEMPQSLEFNLSAAEEWKSLANFIRGVEPTRIELLDPANTPSRFVDLLLGLKIPYDIVIADAGLLDRQSQQNFAASIGSLASCEHDKRGKALPRSSAAKLKRLAGDWRLIADGAQRIVVPCAQAEAFAANILPRRAKGKIIRAYESGRRAKGQRRKAASPHLGFVPVRPGAHEQRLVLETARQLTRLRPDISQTVIGAALDELGLMRGGTTFVTGTVEPEEFEGLIRTLGVEYLFVCTTRPLFGHPILLTAFSSSLPTAYFDWSGVGVLNQKDIAIDPTSSLAELVDALGHWMQSHGGTKARGNFH